MSLFSRQSRAGSTPIGAVVEGDAAIFSWKANLRARLDDQISRATTVALTAAKSWANLHDPPPVAGYLARALNNSGLWGSENEPGIHIVRWSESERTVTLRAWDWDLSRPLGDGGYAPMARARTLPWPTRADEAAGSVPEDDFARSESDCAPAPQPAECPRSPREGSEDVLGELGSHHDFRQSESPAAFARLRKNQILVTLAGLVIFLAVGVLALVGLEKSSLAPSVETLLRIILYSSAGLWLHRRGLLVSRVRTRPTLNGRPTVGDALTPQQRVLHVLWRTLVVALICGFPTIMIAYLAGMTSGFVLLGLFVVFLATKLWYSRFADRPADS